MKLKLLTLSLIFALVLFSMVASADALVPKKSTAAGSGVFVHEHEGLPHNHYFVFNVIGNPCESKGSFRLICEHDGQIATIIVSIKITDFSVERVHSGLRADFSGTAWVKMHDMPWEKGWTFEVTAYDLNSCPDMMGITLINPDGQVHCAVEPTPLNSGNIRIKC